VEPSNKTSPYRLSVGPYFADIVRNSQAHELSFHWIMQKVGSARVIAWGQEATLEAAEKAAYAHLQEQLAKEQSAG
jgi:hypothetical protein